MHELSYELLIRHAHAFKTGTEAKRFSHPKANADLYKPHRIVDVREGLGYAFDIFVSAVLAQCSINDDERERLKNYMPRLNNANDLDAISELMDEFRSGVYDKYFDIANRSVPHIKCE